MAREASRQSSGRVRSFDALRGFSVISMVLFHLCYDLKFISGYDLAWFAPPLQDIWRASISWVFVSLAGCMFAFSRDNLKRAGRYLAVAALVFLVTTVARVDTPINFGVIYCMGACTLTCWILDRIGVRPQGWMWAAAFFVAFVFLLGLPRGYVGFPTMTWQVPRSWYSTPWFSWLGLPGPGFSSGDYYPLLPFFMLYLAGSSVGRLWKSSGVPQGIATASCPPLEAIGRQALPIYIIHQPLLLLVINLL